MGQSIFSSLAAACWATFSPRLASTWPWLVGANHFTAREGSHQEQGSLSSSIGRQRQMEELVQKLYYSREPVRLPAYLIRVLADDGIEGRGASSGTAYANVAWPITGELWYTFGGYPAASQALWAGSNGPGRNGACGTWRLR